jgi:hypothetical protein
MSTTGSSSDTPSFEPRPTLQYTATVGMQAALVGAFVSSVQNALGTHSRGASGFLSRTGGTIGFFGVFWQTFFRLGVQVLISDYLCAVRSCHGCNVRCHRIHRCESTGDAGCAKRRSWWLRSRFFGWYQRCTPFQLLVHLVLMFSAARSLPIAVASCAVIGAAVGTFDTAGQSLRGDQEALSYEEKRKRFFKQTSSSPPLSSLQ